MKNSLFFKNQTTYNSPFFNQILKNKILKVKTNLPTTVYISLIKEKFFVYLKHLCILDKNINMIFDKLINYLKLDKQEFIFQFNSHPNYPSALAFSDTLNFMGVKE
jgi:hypothetical protein